MSTHLPSRPSLSSLRKQAKTLLKRARHDEPEALRLIREHHPEPHNFCSLRDAQLVIAREYGHAGWADLCRWVEEAVNGGATREQKAELFADLACLSYSGNDNVSRRERATRILAEAPDISQVNCYAAATAFDVEALKKQLAEDREAATRAGGPRDWLPLFYVCYSRLSEDTPERDAVDAARLLIDAGAAGDAHVNPEELGGWRWSGLTGVMGEGEHGLLQQPPHSRARELAELLLDAGADPNDSQGLYNTMFTPDNQWLELLLSRGLEASAPVDPDSDSPMRTLDFQLSHAVKSGFAERVSLLLEHGVDAEGADVYNERTYYENAVLGGFSEMAELLVKNGAKTRDWSPADRFRAAVMSRDTDTASQLLSDDPALLDNPDILVDAIRNADATRLLLDLGVDPNMPKDSGRVALHEAAWSDAGEVVETLLARGARCDVRESEHSATPVGFANHAGHFTLRDLLLDHSGDVFDLAAYGRAAQLETVLQTNPSLATARIEKGRTPIHGILKGGVDGERVVDLLLQHGADINVATEDGSTPLSLALERDDEEIATLLRARGAKEGGSELS